jgi:hypothetical protein
MKIIYLPFCICILFLAQTLGCDASDDYARELWEKDKQRMVATGVISSAELEKLESEGDDIVSGFEAAEEQGNSTQADAYRIAFAELVDKLTALTTKG